MLGDVTPVRLTALCGAAVLALCSFVSAPAASLPTSIAIQAERFFPESIDTDSNGTVYVGSAGRGGVWKIGVGDTAPKPFIRPGAARGRAIFGVKVDRAHRTIWACSNELDDSLPGLPSTKVGSTLGKFDLASGRPIASIDLPSTASSGVTPRSRASAFARLTSRSNIPTVSGVGRRGASRSLQ